MIKKIKEKKRKECYLNSGLLKTYFLGGRVLKLRFFGSRIIYNTYNELNLINQNG